MRKLTGKSTCACLLAGSEVDLLLAPRSLIYVDERDWIRVRDILDLGVLVTVRVRAIRDPYRFRFPLELDCIEPSTTGLLTVAPPYYPPIFIYEGETFTDAAVGSHARLRLFRTVLTPANRMTQVDQHRPTPIMPEW